MLTNLSGRNLIKKWESVRLRAYLDQRGIWTIGWGHTGHDVTPGMMITIEQANALLVTDLSTTETAVTNLTARRTPNENQFAAMVSLTYNIGPGAFGASTVLRQHLAGQFTLAAAAFLMWDKSHIDGALVSIPGLLDRRTEERALYLAQVAA